MKDKFSYSILLFISKAFSLLPFGALYLISNIFSFFLYYIVRYRRGVVRKNLKISFPKKELFEIIRIEKEFYKYLCDYFLETLTLVYIKPSILQKKIKFTNPEVLDKYFERKQSIILVAAHYGNWEMTALMPHFIKHKGLAVYKPQSNKGFDKFFIRLRQRFGLEAVPMAEIGKKLFKYSKQGIPTITYLLSDQRPDRFNVRYWTMFLNQETPMILGPEKLSVKMDFPVFFLENKRISRGYYEATFKLIEESPKLTQEFEITEKLSVYLNNIINNDPIPWFWVHRRWKHRRFRDFLEMTHRTIDHPAVAYNKDLIKP